MPILEFSWTRKTAIAVLLGLSATGVWAWRIGIADSFDPGEFKKTEAIDAVVTATTKAGNGYVLTVHVANQSRQTAEQVVLTARLIDNDRPNAVAVNPLVGIRQLAPNEQRAIDIAFPSVTQVADMEGRVEVTLVRWANE